jgi:chromosome segregation ATPase
MVVILVVKISDLNKREREVRKSLNDLEKQLKGKNISKDDYSRLKKEKEGELKQIGVDRRTIIEKLPPIPPPPKPTRSVITSRNKTDITELRTDLQKQEKDITFTQAEVSKIFAEVVRNREKIKVIEELAKKASSTAKTAVPGVDPGEIDNKISAKMDAVHNQVKISLEKSREDMDKMMGELKGLRTDLDGLKKTHSKLETMDVSGLRRDVESLKQKNAFLEQQITSIDMESIYDMIKEVERKVMSKMAGPVIIE